MLWPETPVLDAYKTLMGTRGLVFSGMAVSALRITVGTSCNMAVTILLAYALSKEVSWPDCNHAGCLLYHGLQRRPYSAVHAGGESGPE